MLNILYLRDLKVSKNVQMYQNFNLLDTKYVCKVSKHTSNVFYENFCILDKLKVFQEVKGCIKILILQENLTKSDKI